MSEIKPKPCPFCGSKSVRIFRTEFMKKNGSYRTRYNAYCGNCKARGPQYIANGIGMNELNARKAYLKLRMERKFDSKRLDEVF